jgi:biopolymer transport protein ExbB
MRLGSSRTSCFPLLIFWAVLAVMLTGLSRPALAQDAVMVQKNALAMVWDVAKTPPYVFLVLVLCSVFTVTLLIERFMYYRSATGSAEELIAKIKQTHTIADALAATEHAPGAAGRVIRTAVQAAHDGYKPEQVESLAESAATKELISLERFLPQIDSMVTLCPLLGLLGTTVGMIKSFSIVAAIGMSDPTKLAGGISEALVNTAAGLAVAIPALFAYNYFAGKKEAILMDLEKGVTELMVILDSSAQR